MTFGFVARARGSAGLRGARFQAVFGGSSPAGIGWNLSGMLPHLMPQGTCQGATLNTTPGYLCPGINTPGFLPASDASSNCFADVHGEDEAV